MAEQENIEGNARYPQAPDEGGQGQAEPWGRQTRVVGNARPRVDAYERVSGSAVFPTDVVLPGMVHGAILGSPHANARVKSVDTAKAENMPGVYAVISRNNPDANLDWPYAEDYTGKLFDEHCRFEGDAVAAVAAATPYQAADALRAVEVEYETLPFVSDVTKALEPGAAWVHEGGNRAGSASYSRGDLKQGFAEADTVLEQSYRSASQMQTPLEPHGCVVNWEGNRLTVWESTQGVFAVQSEVAKVLGLPLAQVRVIGHYLGGAFGSKLQTSKYSIIAAQLARRINRPVKLFMSREQTFLTMGNRPPTDMRIKAGVKKDGTLSAIQFQGIGASGAYSAGGTSLLDWLAKDLYRCANVSTDMTDVYINAQPARPFRAPGYVQCSWAMEQMMDALAEAIDMDPVELRLRNIPDTTQVGDPKPYTTEGLRLCIEQGAEAFGWRDARRRAREQSKGHIRRGVGMAAANWYVGDGGPPCTVIVRLYADGTANLNMGASDIGTGTKTAMAMVVAEELGLDPDAVQIEHADTATTQFATPSGGSKTVPTEAPTVRRACMAVKDELMDMAAVQLGRRREEIIFAGDQLRTADGLESLAIGDLDRLQNQKVAVGIGRRQPNPQDVSITPFAAQFCEVEVNTLTGEVKLLRMLGTNESGRVINRLTWDGQLVGGITMGVGYATTEFRVLDGPTGKLCNKNWHDYKLPTALDVPAQVTSSPVELSDEQANIVGAKGLGEPVTIPTGGAIANAIYDATGVRMTDTPINPMTLLQRINAKEA